MKGVRFGAALVAGLLALTGLSAAAQERLAEVRGVVLEADGTAAAAIRVVLLDALGASVDATTTGSDGRFWLARVAPGRYRVEARATSQRRAVVAIGIGGSLPVDLELRLPAAFKEEVVVSQGEGGGSETLVAGETLRRLPARAGGRGLQAAIATTPGFASEDNGLLHVRGIDDGVLFVIDGVPIYERLDTLFGQTPDVDDLATMEVRTGHMSAEHGGKGGAVVELSSGVSTADRWSGGLSTSLGQESERRVQGALSGPVGANTAASLSIVGERSDRFLDPVTPENLHNQGERLGIQGQFLAAPRPRDLVRMAIHAGRARHDVPHALDQEARGQDQRQSLDQVFGLVTWQHAPSERTTTSVAVQGWNTRGELRPSPNDWPISPDSRRESRRLGLLGSVARRVGSHALKAGAEAHRISLKEDFRFFATASEDDIGEFLSEAARGFTAERPFVFSGRRRGTQAAAYVQDSWRHGRFQVEAGLRLDHDTLPTAESQVSPRFAIGFDAWPGTSFRASVNRLFQAPQREHLLLSSSTEARVLSPFEGGGQNLRAERQTAMELGVTHRLGSAARVDASVWRRSLRNVGDPNIFFGTTIFFPNSVARGKARGFDVRVEVPRRGGASAYASYSYAKVEQFGPINGGLFLEPDIIDIGPGTRFIPDHDQRSVVLAGLSYSHERSGAWATVSARYESGTPLEVDESDLATVASRPGGDRVDVATGRVKPRTVVDVAAGAPVLRRSALRLELRGEVRNAFDARYAYNFGNPFSGTHFGPPRTLAFSLRASFGGAGP